MQDQKLAEQSLLVAKEAQKLLATMLNLQQHLAKDRFFAFGFLFLSPRVCSSQYYGRKICAFLC